MTGVRTLSGKAAVRVEFVGIPGAGKSTVAEELARILRQTGRSCVNSPSFVTMGRCTTRTLPVRLWTGCVDFAHGVELTFRFRRFWTRLLPARRQPDVVLKYWRLVRTWAALRRTNRPGDSTIQIFDQGVLQALGSLLPKDLDRADIRKLTALGLAGLSPVLPQVAVVLELDEFRAVARIRERPYQRLSHDIWDPHLHLLLTPYRIFAEDILPASLGPFGVAMVRLRGDESPTRNAERVLDHLLDLEALA